MKVTIRVEDLQSALGRTLPAAVKNSSLRVLSMVRIKAEEDALVLAANNLELSVTVTLDKGVEVEETGAVCIPAHTLYDLVRELNGSADVTLATPPPPDPPQALVDDAIENGTELEWEPPLPFRLLINSEASEAYLDGLTDDEYPLPMTGAEELELYEWAKGSDFARQSNTVITSAASDESVIVLTQILFDFEQETPALATADGFRMACLGTPRKPEGNAREVLLSASAVKAIMRSIDAKEPLTAALLYDEEDATQRHVRFESGNAIIVCQSMGAKFPPYPDFAPKTQLFGVTLNAEPFLRKLALANLFTGGTHVLRLTVRNGESPELAMNAVDDSLGTLNDSVPVTLEFYHDSDDAEEEDSEPAPFQYGLNLVYFRDLLKSAVGASGESNVTLEFSDSGSPMTVKPADEAEFLGVCMPLSLLIQ